jgi:ribosomal protein L44E
MRLTKDEARILAQAMEEYKYKVVNDRKNNMSDEDIEKQRRFDAQAAAYRRQRRIEDNLEKKIYKKIIKSLLKKL